MSREEREHSLRRWQPWQEKEVRRWVIIVLIMKGVSPTYHPAYLVLNGQVSLTSLESGIVSLVNTHGHLKYTSQLWALTGPGYRFTSRCICMKFTWINSCSYRKYCTYLCASCYIKNLVYGCLPGILWSLTRGSGGGGEAHLRPLGTHSHL